MKLDALDHPKTLHFAALLDVSRPTAIGHLELLWAYTGKHSAQGNVGKWPDGAIARSCEWMGSPEVFVAALVDSKFLDRDPSHRLTVHDWSDHAPGWVRAKLKKVGLDFISSEPSSDDSSEGSSDPPSDGTELDLRDDSSPPENGQKSTSEPSILAKRSVAKRSVVKRSSDTCEIPAFHREVIDAYRRILPGMPTVKAWTDKRQGALNARIAERVKDGKPANTVDYWASFFEHVAQSDFLCGRKGDFRCDLEWLLRPENFLKVIEGRYNNTNRANGAMGHAG